MPKKICWASRGQHGFIHNSIGSVKAGTGRYLVSLVSFPDPLAFLSEAENLSMVSLGQ